MTDNRRPDLELGHFSLPPGYIHQVFNQLSSTMTVVDAVMRDQPELRRHGLVVQAVTQVRGEGTNGRKWESPAGNLYFSMLVEQKKLHHRTIALLAVLAIVQAVKEAGIHAQVDFKMPNDVLIKGQKLSGILAEQSLCHDGFCNIGIGINVQVAPELADQRNTATSLVAHGWDKQQPAEKFLEMFLDHFEHGYRCSQMDQTYALVELGAADLRSNTMTIRTDEGREISGEFDGFVTEGDDRDYLVVKDGATRHRSRAALTDIRLVDGRWATRYPYPL